MDYPVGAVARLAGVTVRALHHYDEIGLLEPSARTAAGYRRYSPADLDRLHRILTYRELGFALPEIAKMLDAPPDRPIDLAEHLRRQHLLLTERIDRLTRMATTITHALEAQMAGIDLTPEEIFEVFGSTDVLAYDDGRPRGGARPPPTSSRVDACRPTARRNGHRSRRKAT